MDLWALTDLCTPWCVHVVITLRVAEHLVEGRNELGALAEAAGADRDALQRVLRHLIEKGLFKEPRPGHFELNDGARALLGPEARVAFDLDGFGGRMAHAWGTLLQAVRTGKPAYREVFGRDYWDDLAAHPAIAAQFDELMGPAGHGVPDPEVLPSGDWENIRTVVDVGGGTGSLLVEILKKYKNTEGILVDLPSTVAKAGRVFAAAGVAERAGVAGQSFFDPLPAGGDLYILSRVLVDWPDKEALAILRRCAEAARKSSGRVVVFTNSDRGEPAPPDLLMLVLVGGKSRTIEELEAMGTEAGLVIRKIGRQASGRVLVEFRGTE